MSSDAPAYGLWSLVLINSAIFLFFAFSFTKPKTARDWRSFGWFAAFIVAPRRIPTFCASPILDETPSARPSGQPW